MDVFSHYAPFIQDYIYEHGWRTLRPIQVAAAEEIFETEDKINLILLDAVKKLPDIIHLVENNNSKIIDISIRQNTLEDVFIELTGRQLRE